MQALRWVAESLGKIMFLKINDLRPCDSAVTRVARRRPLCGAVVEFSGRATIGFAHG